MYSIYKITNKVNGKIYIGYTEKSLEQRFAGHCSESRRAHRSAIQDAVKKYGKDSFSIESLYEGTDKEYTLNTMEQYWIDTYKEIVGWDNMYNIAPGGLGGDRSMSPAYQDYIQNRPSRAGKDNHFYGMAHTEETKQKISEANKGRLKGIPKSEETRKKMSVNNPRYWQGKVAHNKGKKQRPPTVLEKAKQGNPVRYNGEVYPTLAAAARANESTPYKVGKCCDYITLDVFISEYKGQL